MPETKTEKLIFGILMAFVMTYAMEVYNLSLQAKGLTSALFVDVFRDVFFMMLIVFFMEKLVAGKLAGKAANRLLRGCEVPPFFHILTTQCCTVWLMCPLMSMVATLLFKHPGAEIVAVWLQTAACNFPMAFFWQIFFAGPLVRWIFRMLFRRKAGCV